MSGQLGNQELRNPVDYQSWQDAALGGELGSYVARNLPSLGQIVPGYREDEPSYQKVLDYLSAPARVAAGPILQGGEAFQRWMAGEQGPDVRQQITSSMLGIGARGLGIETPGPASFGAWHGSRHLFEGTPESPLGEFRDEAIGTGEGAQSYAHGHYVAGSKGVAESYKTAGSDLPEQGTFKLDGQVVKPLNFWNASDDTVPGTAERMQKYWGLHFLADHNGNHDAAIKDLHSQAAGMYNQAKNPGSDPHGVEISREGLLQNALEYSQASRWLRDNKDRLSYEPPERGHLYQVSVRPDEHELLDWDKPLAEQSPQVRERVKNVLQQTQPLRYVDPEHFFNTRTGNDFYQRLTMLGDPQSASRTLHEAGIPGIKYLDQGSRYIDVRGINSYVNPDHKFGVFDDGNHVASFVDRDSAEAHAESMRTRNYVIFHPSNLKITGRDGQTYSLGPIGEGNDLEPVDHDPWGQQ